MVQTILLRRDWLSTEPRTAWSTESYLNQLGSQPPAFKRGTGVLLEMPANTHFSQLDLQGLTPGSHVEIRIAGDKADSLADTRVLTDFAVRQSRTVVRSDDSNGNSENGTSERSQGEWKTA